MAKLNHHERTVVLMYPRLLVYWCGHSTEIWKSRRTLNGLMHEFAPLTHDWQKQFLFEWPSNGDMYDMIRIALLCWNRSELDRFHSRDLWSFLCWIPPHLRAHFLHNFYRIATGGNHAKYS